MWINRLVNDFITLNLHSLASMHFSTFVIFHLSRAKFYDKNFNIYNNKKYIEIKFNKFLLLIVTYTSITLNKISLKLISPIVFH